ncbi:hypothetical protein SLA2020_469060 [Shorea laevis]
MQTLLHNHPCKSFALLSSSPPLNLYKPVQYTALNSCSVKRTPISRVPKALPFSRKFRFLRDKHVVLFSKNDSFDDFSNTQLPEKVENDGIEENEGLELLNKPSPAPVNNGIASEVGKESEKANKDEALQHFLKFFKPRDSLGEGEEMENEGVELGVSQEESDESKKESDEPGKVNVEYYGPRPGDFVVGVVVSGNENKLDVNVGADMLGTMLTKEVLPLYDKDMEYLLCDRKNNLEEFMVHGKIGIVKDEDAMGGEPVLGRPVVETGTVLFAEVLGRTLSGRPLLSTRRFFRRIAWHRVRQIKQLNEPIEVEFREWNTGGLLTRVEGLRAFLPKAQLMKRVNNFTELKNYVGCRMYVLITRVNEANNDLILSERDAWEMLHLQEGTLVDGTVKKILPYGAQIIIGESNKSGLLHISNMSKNRITAVDDLLKEGEKVKVLVVKSPFPDKISLSIADLESEPGLFISNKQKVFSEAEEMAKQYRQKLPAGIAPRNKEPFPTEALSFDDEASLYANWKWFKFERDDETN